MVWGIFTKFMGLDKFDKITQFRLINAFLISIGLSIIAPALIILKGTLMLPWVISVLSIISTLSVKTNKYLTKLDISLLYKIGVIIHLILILNTSIYFYNPTIMIYLDSLLLIIDISIFSAYSIKLNNYLADNYPNTMNEFQIVRNSTWADGTIIGLSISTLLMYIDIQYSIIAFISYNSLLCIRFLYNWNFYDNFYSNINDK